MLPGQVVIQEQEQAMFFGLGLPVYYYEPCKPALVRVKMWNVCRASVCQLLF